MSKALYRKYRPQTFSEVIGQEHIKQSLINQLKSGRTTHAYLFCGPRGIGKTTLARLMSKSVNCLEPKEGEPCNQCKNCKTINSGRSLDVIEIDAASNTGVDNVRDNIINNAQVASGVLKNKVFIIDEVHMLSTSAFNALLKTLEEPPKNVIFILATTEIHKVPATIISRCQRFDFKKVPLKEIVKKLEKIVINEKVKVDINILERVAKNSEGCARDAESLLGQIIALDDKEITKEMVDLVLPTTELSHITELFYLLANKNIKTAISHINKLVEEGVNLQEFNKSLVEFLRKILLYKISGNLSELEYLDVDKKSHEEINIALDKISLLKLKQMIEIFLDKISALKSTPIIQLPLELAIVEICDDAPLAWEIKKTEAAQKEIDKKKITNNLELDNNPANNNINDIPKLSGFSKNNLTQNQENQQLNQTQKKPEEDKETLEKIKKDLPEIIKALRVKNHSLALTFSIAELVAFDTNNTLTLGVRYQFHSDRLCDAENLVIIEEVLTEKFKRPVKVVCVVDQKYENKKIDASKSDNLDNVSEEETGNVWDLAVNAFNVEEGKSEEQKK